MNSPTRAPSARVQWIDVARGVLILLVIFTHVIVSSTDAGHLNPNGFWSAVHYPMQMSAIMADFAFLSGVFVAGRINRPGRVLGSLTVDLLWPYLIWVMIFILGQELLGGVRNQQGTVPLEISLLWTSVGWLWYLYALAIFHVLALAMRRRVWLLPVIGLLLLPLSTIAPSLLARQFAYLLPFYGLGVWLGRPSLPRIPYAGLAAVVLSIAAWQIQLPYFHSLTAIISLLWLVAAVQYFPTVDGAPAAVLAWLGQRCMAIYVSHFFFITATRLALEHGLGVTSFAANLPLGFAAGLGGSLALLAVAQRMGIAGLLGFGKLPLTWPTHRGNGTQKSQLPPPVAARQR